MGESMWRPVTELSSYPTDLDAHVTLTDQRRIRLRALHSREERPIRVLHARLSPRTRTRFAGNGLTTMVEGRSR